MKKILLIVSSVVMLSACDTASSEDTHEKERFSGIDTIGGGDVIIDEETGCKYLYVKVASSGGLSPLYNENGEIDCDKSTIKR